MTVGFAGIWKRLRVAAELLPSPPQPLPLRPFTGSYLATFTMTKHSKNNTASSIFSYAEYKKLDYGTRRVSLHSIWVA